MYLAEVGVCTCTYFLCASMMRCESSVARKTALFLPSSLTPSPCVSLFAYHSSTWTWCTHTEHIVESLVAEATCNMAITHTQVHGTCSYTVIPVANICRARNKAHHLLLCWTAAHYSTRTVKHERSTLCQQKGSPKGIHWVRKLVPLRRSMWGRAVPSCLCLLVCDLTTRNTWIPTCKWFHWSICDENQLLICRKEIPFHTHYPPSGVTVIVPIFAN